MHNTLYSFVTIIRKVLLAILRKIDTPREQGAAVDGTGFNLEQGRTEPSRKEAGAEPEGGSLSIVCMQAAMPVRIAVVCRNLTTTASMPGEEPTSLNCRSTILAYAPLGEAAPKDFNHLGIHDPPAEVKTIQFVNAETARLLTGVIHHN